MILDVTDDGAIVEYDCGNGTIGGPIILDKDGRFEAKGSHVTERPGPVRVGRESGAQPASYTGRVDAETMTLTVKLTQTGQTVGTYTLGYGKASRLRKCL